MKISLYTKFIIAYIIFGICAFLTITNVSSNITYKYLINAKAETLYKETNLIADYYSNLYKEKYNISVNAPNHIQAISTFLQSEIWLVNTDGKIIIDSNNKRNDIVLNNFDPTDTNSYYSQGKFYDCFDKDVLSVYSPIIANFKTYGYIIIHMPLDVVLESRNHILNIVHISCLIVFSFSLLILLFFHFIVYKPLHKITIAAKHYAGGDLQYNITMHNHDEMGYLANTLQFMASEIYKAEDYQKKFITNISHDFRSPLTSIKGYLNAILDGTINTSDINKYINIVLSETDRLTNLTSGILAVKDSDTKGYIIRTSFNIKNVIKDTATSFFMQCKKKNITIELSFIEDDIIVYADIGKIQQVLYNLIDNAIKFSKNNSSINVSTSIKYDKVFISIKDNGIGISQNDIGNIFNRFYKSDMSRGMDKKGTGLGLAIVKDIINAHGENIDVISTINIGTEFIFTLPLYTES